MLNNRNTYKDYCVEELIDRILILEYEYDIQQVKLNEKISQIHDLKYILLERGE